MFQINQLDTMNGIVGLYFVNIGLAICFIVVVYTKHHKLSCIPTVDYPCRRYISQGSRC